MHISYTHSLHIDTCTCMQSLLLPWPFTLYMQHIKLCIKNTCVCISDTGYETVQDVPIAGPTPRLHPASGATPSMLIHVHRVFLITVPLIINEKSYATIIPRFPHLCMHCCMMYTTMHVREAVDRGFSCTCIYIVYAVFDYRIKGSRGHRNGSDFRFLHTHI